MTEIGFHSLCKKFKKTSVIDDLNLTIENREFFTFVGPSGCGKSTILNMVAGLESITSGMITFDGHSIDGLPPGERDIAMVFQSYALYPHMTVRENLAFPLSVRKVPSADRQREVEKIAALLALTPFLSRLPRELSGGQRQRVALGRALIRKPKVFLMDEPLSNLDAKLRIEMRTELKRLHREFPVTTIYVTHDQEEAMALSDRIALLHEGALRQCGPPQEVYAAPANLFSAGFIGSPPMNFIEGTLLLDLPFLASRLAEYRNQPFIAGIRPTDLRITGEKRENTLSGRVLFLETTGETTWIDLEWRGNRIRGKTGPVRRTARDETAYFTIPPEKLHLFDKSSGERLW